MNIIIEWYFSSTIWAMEYIHVDDSNLHLWTQGIVLVGGNYFELLSSMQCCHIHHSYLYEKYFSQLHQYTVEANAWWIVNRSNFVSGNSDNISFICRVFPWRVNSINSSNETRSFCSAPSPNYGSLVTLCKIPTRKITFNHIHTSSRIHHSRTIEKQKLWLPIVLIDNRYWSIRIFVCFGLVGDG